MMCCLKIAISQYCVVSGNIQTLKHFYVVSEKKLLQVLTFNQGLCFCAGLPFSQVQFCIATFLLEF